MPIFPGTLSNIEMSWLLKPNFFPTREDALTQRRLICIGTKSRNLGDALILTPLAEQLKQKFPTLKIYTFARAFNPVVFYGNPAIERVKYLPRQVFGDDCNLGEGQLIHQKQRFFDLTLSPEYGIQPKLFLQHNEQSWAKLFLKKHFNLELNKPICILHPSGLTWREILPFHFWESVIADWKTSFHFLQLGLEGDTPLQGAATLFFSRKNFWDARRLFAIMPNAQAFIGVDSGPMHAARAFSVPSLIMIMGEDPNKIFENLERYPYFLMNNRKYCTLYKSNTHLRADGSDLNVLRTACSKYLTERIHF